MENKYFIDGGRLTSQQRQLLKEKGYHVYSMRSWDEGCGCTLEHRVLVNHEGDVITNFEALDESDPHAMANDFYELMQKFNAKDSAEIYEDVKNILEM